MEALAHASRIQVTIQLLDRGRIDLPCDVDPVEFLLSEGRNTQPRQIGYSTSGLMLMSSGP